MFYDLPGNTDIENNLPVTVTVLSPSFAVMSATTLNRIEFNPTQAAEVGLITVDVKLEDSCEVFKTYSFSVNVLNKPPYYEPATFISYVDLTIRLG